MKNVRDYCIPSCTIPAFVSVMLIPVGVIFNAAMSDLGNDMEKALALFMTIATNLVGIPFVWFSFYFNSKIRFEKRLKVCTLSVSEDMIASDFEESSTFFNDKIRVENNCILDAAL